MARIAREVTGPVAWAYVLTKVFFIDIDLIVLHHVAPDLVWILDLRFFILLAASLSAIVAFGWSEFLWGVAFVLAWPLILIFWKIPRRFYNNWPLAVIVIPTVHTAIQQLRTTFVVYALALLGAMGILLATNKTLLLMCICGIVPMLGVHVYRLIKRVFAPSLLTQLAVHLRRWRGAVESAKYLPFLSPNSAATSKTTDIARVTDKTDATTTAFCVYASHAIVHIIAQRIRQVAKGHSYLAYLCMSFVYTFLLYVSFFGFLYFGI